MDKNYIQRKVQEILSDKASLSIDKIQADSLLREDLEIDSFSTIEIVYALEEEFNIKISEEKIREVKKVKDIVNLLWENLKNG